MEGKTPSESCPDKVYASVWQIPVLEHSRNPWLVIENPIQGAHICADSLEDLDPDFVSLGRSDFDVLDAERLVGFPGNRRLTVDDLRRRKRIVKPSS